MTDKELPIGKVLFVDDEEVMRSIFERAAAQGGIKDAEILGDADSAIARIEEAGDSISAVFTDGLHGGWKGVVVAAKAKNIPAFVVSGDSIGQLAQMEGAGFLEKPFSLSALRDVISSVLHPK